MAADSHGQTKIAWKGTLCSIQPRTRIWRYITNNRTPYHIGYNLFIDGSNDEGKNPFVVAISEIQQQNSNFGIGDIIQGTAWTKLYPEREFADFNRAGALKYIYKATGATDLPPPPWTSALPDMRTYEDRGARMLSLSLWKTKCFQCIWANMANVEIAWDIDRRINKYRFESFCYGPKSCKLYKMGRARAVPYKGRDSVLDDGDLDDLYTQNRDYDD